MGSYSTLVEVCLRLIFRVYLLIDLRLDQFVGGFDLVLNALDNVEARRRVNRLCLAANVPLIEAGTTGYLGQITVIHKPSNVACYECKTQETQKVYPICTIRSTPSMPVHTIVWAKELYKLLFHSKVEESMLFEDLEGEEPSSYMQAVIHLRELIRSEADKDNVENLMTSVQHVLVALYQTEIEKQLDMGRYKTAKKTPSPMETKTLLDAISTASSKASNPTPSSQQAVWSISTCIEECCLCIAEAAREMSDEGASVVLEEFDKDDGKFVAKLFWYYFDCLPQNFAGRQFFSQ